MTPDWICLDPPSGDRPEMPVRGIPGLAASTHPAFPETVPHASESVLWVTPVGCCADPEAIGALVRELISTDLPTHPIIVIKHSPVHSRADFSRCFLATGLTRHGYEGGVALRDKADDGVSVASDEPPEVVITAHNENAYMPNPPSIVMFHCLQAAESGGEIPINDVRKIPAELPPDFVAEMRERGMRYVRRVPRKNATLEIGWEQSFATTDKTEVERYLEGEGVTYHWEAADILRFWFERPVFKTYRGEEIWFNQLSESNADWWLHHPVFRAMGATRETIQSDTTYAGGEPFSDEIIATVRAAIWQTTELVRLEPSDIIILDNHLAQHGRLAYQGERRHHVALSADAVA